MTGSKKGAVQRAASLLPLAAMLRDHGVALDDALAGTGVTHSDLRPDAFISFAAYNSILENAARLTGRSDFGLLLGRSQTTSALGPLGTVMRHAASLGEALSAFTAFQINNSTGGAVYLSRADRDVMLAYGAYDTEAKVSPVFHDLIVAVGCTLIAELTAGAVEPQEVLVSRPAPVDLSSYRRICRCPLRFGEVQTGLVLRTASLGFSLPMADADRHAAAMSTLTQLIEGGPPTLSRRVRHLLRPHLLEGRGNMLAVAEQLGVHPRVLRRRLHAEGATFEALKDAVRFSVARELLQIETLTIHDIAATLDYGSASAFVHAFRRCSGQSPGTWRRTSKPEVPESVTPPDRRSAFVAP